MSFLTFFPVGNENSVMEVKLEEWLFNPKRPKPLMCCLFSKFFLFLIFPSLNLIIPLHLRLGKSSMKWHYHHSYLLTWLDMPDCDVYQMKTVQRDSIRLSTHFLVPSAIAVHKVIVCLDVFCKQKHPSIILYTTESVNMWPFSLWSVGAGSDEMFNWISFFLLPCRFTHFHLFRWCNPGRGTEHWPSLFAVL